MLSIEVAANRDMWPIFLFLFYSRLFVCVYVSHFFLFTALYFFLPHFPYLSNTYITAITDGMIILLVLMSITSFFLEQVCCLLLPCSSFLNCIDSAYRLFSCIISIASFCFLLLLAVLSYTSHYQYIYFISSYLFLCPCYKYHNSELLRFLCLLIPTLW